MITHDYAYLLDRKEHQHYSSPFIDGAFEGHDVLVTGAGGSIGSAIVNRLACCDVRQVTALGHGEDSIFQLMKAGPQGVAGWRRDPVPVIAECDDERILGHIANGKYKFVIHTAAHKHVELMETNPHAAYRNNVSKTLRIAAACRESKTRLVFISTDKAANPTTIMGASKRLAEFALQAFYPDSTICRFGNVLGSAGSIVQIVEENNRLKRPTQVRVGMKRFFITAKEAVGLVLTMAPYPGLWTLDMGQPMPLETLLSRLPRCVFERVDPLPSEKCVEEICDYNRGEQMRESLEHAGIMKIIPYIYPGIVRAALDHAEFSPEEMVQIARRV